jgi:hypothetical protein
MSGLRFDALHDVASYAPVLYVADGAPGVGAAVTGPGRGRCLIEVVCPGVEVRSSGNAPSRHAGRPGGCSKDGRRAVSTEYPALIAGIRCLLNNLPAQTHSELIC